MAAKIHSVPILIAILAGLVAPVAALALGPVPQGGPVLVIAADPLGVVERAGGRPIGPTSTRFAALSVGDGNYAIRARENGAWFVKDGGWLAALCGIDEV